MFLSINIIIKQFEQMDIVDKKIMQSNIAKI